MTRLFFDECRRDILGGLNWQAKAVLGTLFATNLATFGWAILHRFPHL